MLMPRAMATINATENKKARIIEKLYFNLEDSLKNGMIMLIRKIVGRNTKWLYGIRIVLLDSSLAICTFSPLITSALLSFSFAWVIAKILSSLTLFWISGPAPWIDSSLVLFSRITGSAGIVSGLLKKRGIDWILKPPCLFVNTAGGESSLLLPSPNIIHTLAFSTGLPSLSIRPCISQVCVFNSTKFAIISRCFCSSGKKDNLVA